jgi:sugar lactone lactonase YvrE
MRSLPFRASFGALFVLAASAGTVATPGFWQAATQADFLRGDLEQLSLDEHGRVMLGPRVEPVHDPATPFVWTVLEGPDDSLFLGTGNDGRVVRVDRNGRGSVFFDATEMEVHAIAPAPNGGLFVGTSPDGRIYKVDSTGNAAPFFDPEDKYIWSLVVGRSGVVYAATGDKGVVYRITPDGDGTRFFTTRTTHAISLGFDSKGQLLVGTGSPGRVFRVDEAGKGFLLLDTSYQEVRSLRVSPGGDIYVATQSSRAAQSGDDRPEVAGAEPPRPAPIPSVSTEITSIAIIDVPVTAQGTASAPARDDRRGPTGAVYRVTADGLWDQLWESRDDAPYDVAFDADGALLVATGSRGKIYRLAGDPLKPTLLARVGAEQATMFARNARRTWLVTANPGLVLSLSQNRAERGTYESDVRDARTVATWGALSWRATTPAGARVELFTRSGNTRAPDEGWSEWSSPYTEPSGSPITSPKARYLQWRAVLTGKAESPVLTSVTAAYLQRNARPQVRSITVHPPGVVFQKPFSTGEAEIAGYEGEATDRRQAEPPSASGASAGSPALGRRSYQKGLQTLVWKAEDDNNDDLTYDLFYRREGETSWKLLKAGLTETIFVWDTTSAPNGAYSVKVAASDQLSNPAESALRGELESTSFDIDNTPPTLTIAPLRREGSQIVVPVDVRDTDSPIRQVQYSLDTERWQSGFPGDGMLDARLERIEIRLPASTAGRTLVIRATDAMNNLGSANVALR